MGHVGGPHYFSIQRLNCVINLVSTRVCCCAETLLLSSGLTALGSAYVYANHYANERFAKTTPSAPNDIEENLPVSVDGERLSKTCAPAKF